MRKGSVKKAENVAAKWIPCGSGFIEADVIRWKEAVWEKRSRRRNDRAVHIGDRVVIAEVMRAEGEWLDLLVRCCSVVSKKFGCKVPALAQNMPVRRKRHTIEKGNPERLLWSDESARALLISKFLSGR